MYIFGNNGYGKSSIGNIIKYSLFGWRGLL